MNIALNDINMVNLSYKCSHYFQFFQSPSVFIFTSINYNLRIIKTILHTCDDDAYFNKIAISMLRKPISKYGLAKKAQEQK